MHPQIFWNALVKNTERDEAYGKFISLPFEERDELLANITKWSLCLRDEFHKIADGDFSKLDTLDEFLKDKKFDPVRFWDAISIEL